MNKFMLGLIILVFSLIGCANVEVMQAADEQEQLEKIVKKNRTLESSMGEPPIDVIYTFMSEDSELTDRELNKLSVSDEATSDVLKEDLLEDVEMLNSTWKYAYPLYEWYGGNESFDQAYEQLVETIKRNYESGAEVDHDDFVRHLQEHYRFITDQHVHIDGEPLTPRKKQFYTTEQMMFIADESGDYWLYENGETTDRLESVNNDENVDDYVVPSLNDEGELVYFLGQFSNNLSVNPWLLAFDNNSRMEVTIRRVGFDYLSDRTFNVYEEDGVPIVQMRSMSIYEDSPHDYDDMLNAAHDVKDESYFILDLRNNFGGNSDFVSKWFEELFGVKAGLGEDTIRLFSTTNNVFFENTVQIDEQAGLVWETFDETTDDYFRFEEYDFPRDPVWDIEKSQLTTIENNDTPIFVIIDEGTTSAAEVLTQQLKQVNDVYIVGAPTAGAIHSSNALIWELPNSGISVSVPSVFSYNHDMNEKEAVGIEPDIWVHPRFAKARVISWIENHY